MQNFVHFGMLQEKKFFLVRIYLMAHVASTNKLFTVLCEFHEAPKISSVCLKISSFRVLFLKLHSKIAFSASKHSLKTLKINEDRNEKFKFFFPSCARCPCVVVY